MKIGASVGSHIELWEVPTSAMPYYARIFVSGALLSQRGRGSLGYGHWAKTYFSVTYLIFNVGLVG